jgi:very-short-patch-repair endonuclease
LSCATAGERLLNPERALGREESGVARYVQWAWDRSRRAGEPWQRCGSRFEREVCVELRRIGIGVVPGFQIGPYRVGLVAYDRREPALLVLAIECDGPPHEDPRRRAHDARRDAVLSDYGLATHRVPIDWWEHSRDGELRRIVEAYEREYQVFVRGLRDWASGTRSRRPSPPGRPSGPAASGSPPPRRGRPAGGADVEA